MFCISVVYAQDPPSEFEFNQSTAQSFYSFSSLQILGEDIEQDDWISAFNVYDETLSGVCTQEFINFDGPYLLNVIVEKEGNVFPMVPSGESVSNIRLE